MDLNFVRKTNQSDINVRINNGVPYLFFQNIEKTNKVIHGFSTRLGGVSKEHLKTMNLSFTRGDEEESVIENYKRITNALGVEYESLVLSYQTHTTNIRVVTKNDRGKGIIKERDYTDIDGFITNDPSVTLVTFYADCVPLYFVDPIHNAIGLSHSGWRGTVNQIGKKTLEKMHEQYGTMPEDVVAAIGPSICLDCYEVSEDVAEEFKKNFEQKKFMDICYKKDNNKYQLDLWKANEYVLRDAGIKKENISISNICTCCNPELLFSHRASKGLRGNLAAFLSLKK